MLFFNTKWKIEPTIYPDGYKEYFIYQKIFGLLWIKRFRRFTFLCPFDGGSYRGYDSVDDAIIIMEMQLGHKYSKIIENNNLKISDEVQNGGFYIIKNHKGFSIVHGSYHSKNYNNVETFIPFKTVIEPCKSAIEAIMKAKLQGIDRIDNERRYL